MSRHLVVCLDRPFLFGFKDRALGRIHTNARHWDLVGRHRRTVRPTDAVHPSVRYRVRALSVTDHPYTPRLPARHEPASVRRHHLPDRVHL